MAVTFGDLLKQLRKRSGMTQSDLAAAVGYSVPFISHLESNHRLPAVEAIVNHFIPALCLHDEPHLATRLIELAATARGERLPRALTLQRETRLVIREECQTRPTSWPMPPTELIGRDHEVKTICNRLLGHSGRLLTLVGPPGIGKTRLGLAVADKLHTVYTHGVYFVPLAALSEVELVAATLVAALGISDSNIHTPQGKLLEFLRHKELLLFLDNFEQLTAAAPLVAEVLAACPGVRILVTSRERLHLRAEQRYRVPPLTLMAAVQLFVQCAQASDMEFALTPDNQPILTEICQQLDCLPLAIELSAARVDLLTPQALLARLRTQRLELLSDGPRDLPAHQRTLRNAIQRSYALLNEQERSLFRRLGVFVGGFERAALADWGFDELTLQSLIHKSLVQVTARHDEAQRFGLLETLRTYAWEQLCAEGELVATQRLHAAVYLRLAEEATAHFRGPTQANWLERLAIEQGNLRAAIDWALAKQQSDTGARLGIALWRFWYIRGYYEEGWHWLQQLLTQADQPEQRAHLLYGQGMLARRRGDSAAAAEHFAASLTLFRELGEPRGVASALRGLGFIYFFRGDYEGARPLLEEALALFRTLNDQEGVAVTLDNLAYLTHDPIQRQRLYQESLALRRRSGNLHGMTISLTGLAYLAIDQADYTTAHKYLQEQLQINQALGNQNGIAHSFYALGLSAFSEGNYPTAQALYERSLKLCQETGDRSLLAAPTQGLGMIALKHGEYNRARTLLEQALALCQAVSSVSGIAVVLGYLANLAVAQRQARYALCLTGAVAAIYASRHIEQLHVYEVEFERAQTAARQLLSEEAAAAAWATGQAMTLEQVVAYALTQSGT